MDALPKAFQARISPTQLTQHADTFPLVEGRKYKLVQPSHIRAADRAEGERIAADLMAGVLVRPDEVENQLGRQRAKQQSRRFVGDPITNWGTL